MRCRAYTRDGLRCRLYPSCLAIVEGGRYRVCPTHLRLLEQGKVVHLVSCRLIDILAHPVNT